MIKETDETFLLQCHIDKYPPHANIEFLFNESRYDLYDNQGHLITFFSVLTAFRRHSIVYVDYHRRQHCYHLRVSTYV